MIINFDINVFGYFLILKRKIEEQKTNRIKYEGDILDFL